MAHLAAEARLAGPARHGPGAGGSCGAEGRGDGDGGGDEMHT